MIVRAIWTHMWEHCDILNYMRSWLSQRILIYVDKAIGCIHVARLCVQEKPLYLYLCLKAVAEPHRLISGGQLPLVTFQNYMYNFMNNFHYVILPLYIYTNAFHKKNLYLRPCLKACMILPPNQKEVIFQVLPMNEAMITDIDPRWRFVVSDTGNENMEGASIAFWEDTLA